MLRNIIGRIFNAKIVFFFFFFLLLFLNNLILPAERRRFLKNKNREKQKKMDGFSTQKRAIFGRIFNSTAYIYIYTPYAHIPPSLSISIPSPYHVDLFCGSTAARIDSCNCWDWHLARKSMQSGLRSGVVVQLLMPLLVVGAMDLLTQHILVAKTYNVISRASRQER